jgi:hypothetical protein
MRCRGGRSIVHSVGTLNAVAVAVAVAAGTPRHGGLGGSVGVEHEVTRQIVTVTQSVHTASAELHLRICSTQYALRSTLCLLPPPECAGRAEADRLNVVIE